MSMTSGQESTSAPRTIHASNQVPGVGAPTRTAVLACGLALLTVAIYGPVLYASAQRWIAMEQYAHALLVFPISAVLIWWRRDAIRQVAWHPNMWGAIPLTLGLLVQIVSHGFRMQYPELLSLIPTAAGVIIILGGSSLWCAVRFPVCFLGFAANTPGFILDGLSAWIQRESADGAAAVARTVGFALVQHGNLMYVPGMGLEVADVCSGFRKLTALVVMAALYGYVTPMSRIGRLLLVLSVVPISLAANVVRLDLLIAAATWGGPAWEARAHGPAELCVLIVAFALMAGAARLLARIASRRQTPLSATAIPSARVQVTGAASPTAAAGDPSKSAEVGVSRGTWTANYGAAVCALLLTGCLIADFMTGNGSSRPQYRPAAAAFPRQVGNWQGGPDRPVAASTQKLLPTASILDRFYTDTGSAERRRTVSLVLVSAALLADAHDPELCLPGQGWKVEHLPAPAFGDRAVHYDRVVQDGQSMDVLYWWDVPRCSGESWMDSIEKTRMTLWGRGTILVRLATPTGPESNAVLEQFARQIIPVIERWKQPPAR